MKVRFNGVLMKIRLKLLD